MVKQDIKRRFFYPVFIIFLIMSISWTVYNIAWRIGNPAIHQTLATITGTLLFLSVTFGTLFIYPVAYFRGASLKERILASLINPFLWATKENLRLLISFSFSESLYYYLNPLNIWLLCGLVAQMGIAEIFCRHLLKKRGEAVRVLAPGPISAIIIGLFLVITLFAWGQGENVYVIFLEGYRKIFGSDF